MLFPSTPSPQLETYQQACCVHSKLHFLCIEAKTNQFVNLPPVGKLIQVCLKCGTWKLDMRQWCYKTDLQTVDTHLLFQLSISPCQSNAFLVLQVNKNVL